jgi:hypothetical protein
MHRSILLIFAFPILIAGALSCARGTKTGQTDAPLLLENTTRVELVATSSRDVADNSRCFVCHLNYDGEELADQHAAAGVGCENCHGLSDAHCGDENNVTPPDIMYAEDAINKACIECHSKSQVEVNPEHEEFLAGKSDEQYCTDCHGEHRLTCRTRHWNKRSGELLETM